VSQNYSKQAVAIAWAKQNLGGQDWDSWCAKFVANAYGQPAAGYNTAAELGTALKASPTTPNIGDLVFFKADSSNNNAGHVGIYLGDGKMVSATYKGVKTDSLSDPYWSKLLIGYAPPPESWKGKPATDDLIKGAMEVEQQMSNTTDTLQKQLQSQSDQLKILQSQQSDLQLAAQGYSPAVGRTGSPIQNKTPQERVAAQDKLAAIGKQISDLQNTITATEKDLAGSRDTDAKTTNQDKIQIVNGKPYTTVQTPNGLSLVPVPGTDPDLHYIDLGDKIVGLDSSGKTIATLDKTSTKQNTWLQTKDKLIQIDASGNPTGQTITLPADKQIQGRADGSFWAIDPKDPSKATQIVGPLTPGYDQTQAQKDLQTAQASSAQAMSASDWIKYEELNRQAQAGELTQANQAQLDDLRAKVQQDQASAQLATRRAQPGGIADLQDQQSIAQGQAGIEQTQASTAYTKGNTLTDREIQARADEAQAKALQEQYTAAFNKRVQDVAELVASGTMTPEEALVHTGKYSDFLQNQLDARRQAETERHDAMVEQAQMAAENRSTAELEAQLLSNEQGSAIFRGRAGGVGAQSQGAIGVNIPGNQADPPGIRLLKNLGLQHPMLGNLPARETQPFVPAQIRQFPQLNQPGPVQQPAPVQQAAPAFIGSSTQSTSGNPQQAQLLNTLTQAPPVYEVSQTADDLRNGMAQNYQIMSDGTRRPIAGPYTIGG
jgi:hypothetical protein